MYRIYKIESKIYGIQNIEEKNIEFQIKNKFKA